MVLMNKIMDGTDGEDSDILLQQVIIVIFIR